MSKLKSSEQCWDELIWRLEKLTGFDDNFHKIKHLVKYIEKFAYNEGQRSVKAKKKGKQPFI